MKLTLLHVRTGWPIYLRPGGFLRGIIYNLFLGHVGDERRILGVRIGEFFGRCRVYVTETSVCVLENLLGGNHTVVARRNSTLYYYKLEATDL